ncbi:hypothetical protein [Paraburkholderia fungorum]
MVIIVEQVSRHECPHCGSPLFSRCLNRFLMTRPQSRSSSQNRRIHHARRVRIRNEPSIACASR